MKIFEQTVLRLKNYFQTLPQLKAGQKVPKIKFLSDIKALEAFSRLWRYYSGDVLTMNAYIEYEFMIGGYTEEQMRAVKKILHSQMMFLKECAEEVEQIEREREQKHRN